MVLLLFWEALGHDDDRYRHVTHLMLLSLDHLVLHKQHRKYPKKKARLQIHYVEGILKTYSVDPVRRRPISMSLRSSLHGFTTECSNKNRYPLPCCMVIEISITCNSAKIVKLRLNGVFLLHQFLQLFFQLKVHNNSFFFIRRTTYVLFKMNKEYSNTNVMNGDTKSKDLLE